MPRTDQDRQFHYFPAFLDLVRKRAVVVGGGAVAASKVELLLACGLAHLSVVAPEACGSITGYAAVGRLHWLKRAYAPGDVAGADLVFAATSDRALNASVAIEARQQGTLVLAVDDVGNCDFIAPALVRRGDLVVAVSTQGRSPAVARRVREWLDRALPTHWGELLDVAAEVRERLGPRRRVVSAEAWQAGLSATDADLGQQCSRSAAAEQLTSQLLRS